jgi:hypothetical protein
MAALGRGDAARFEGERERAEGLLAALAGEVEELCLGPDTQPTALDRE